MTTISEHFPEAFLTDAKLGNCNNSLRPSPLFDWDAVVRLDSTSQLIDFIIIRRTLCGSQVRIQTKKHLLGNQC